MQVAHPSFENESNIPGEAVRAQINTEGLDHIISILTNLYSDAVLAVIREYSCNAYDSHVEAGTSKPIEVTLPTPLQPTFRVKDWGVGLSEDQILPVFLTYGAGTKSQSNDQIGGFGIGSKSAFTIAHEFTITTVKDGKKVIVLFSLDAYGVPVYKIVFRADTSEANGVEVSLPVDDYEAFRERASVFFSTWQPGTVLVDGRAPESQYDKGIRSGAVQFTGESWFGHDAVAVVGQVAYPLHYSLVQKAFPKLAGFTGILVDLPIGSVDIAPSREALRDTPRTVKALSDVLTDAVGRIAATLADEVAAAPSFSAAARVVKSYSVTSPFLDLTNLEYQGQLIRGVKVSNIPVLSLYKRSYYSEVNKVRTEQVLHLDPTDIEKVLVVRGAKSVTAVARFAKRYLENNEDGVKFIVPVLEGEVYEKEWFLAGTEDDAVPSITAEEYRTRLKAWAPASAAGRNTPRYSVGFHGSNDRDDRTDLADILEDAVDDEVLVFNSYGPEHSRRFLLQGLTVVTLTGSQSWDAAVKNFGDYFVDGHQRLNELAAEYAAKGAPKRIRKAAALRLWWANKGSDVSTWLGLDRSLRNASVELTNPRYLKAIETARRINAEYEKITSHRSPDYYAIDRYLTLRSIVKPDLFAPLPGVAHEVASTDRIPALVKAATYYRTPDHEVANEIVELLNSKQ